MQWTFQTSRHGSFECATKTPSRMWNRRNSRDTRNWVVKEVHLDAILFLPLSEKQSYHVCQFSTSNKCWKLLFSGLFRTILDRRSLPFDPFRLANVFLRSEGNENWHTTHRQCCQRSRNCFWSKKNPIVALCRRIFCLRHFNRLSDNGLCCHEAKLKPFCFGQLKTRVKINSIWSQFVACDVARGTISDLKPMDGVGEQNRFVHHRIQEISFASLFVTELSKHRMPHQICPCHGDFGWLRFRWWRFVPITAFEIHGSHPRFISRNSKKGRDATRHEQICLEHAPWYTLWQTPHTSWQEQVSRMQSNSFNRMVDSVFRQDEPRFCQRAEICEEMWLKWVQHTRTSTVLEQDEVSLACKVVIYQTSCKSLQSPGELCLNLNSFSKLGVWFPQNIVTGHAAITSDPLRSRNTHRWWFISKHSAVKGAKKDHYC